MNTENIEWGIIKRDIKTLGMKTFVDYYYDFQKMDNNELIKKFEANESWILSSRSSKASVGKTIFIKKNQKKTLELILSSNPGEKTIKTATEIYSREYPDSEIEKIIFVRPEFQFGKDIIEKLFNGYDIEAQYMVCGYILDWYIPELNLAIEFDETHHRSQKEEDAKRQKTIEAKIKCKFLRYKY